MTALDFKLLPVQERAKIVKERGKHLSSTLGNHVSSIIYELDDFTVEMWINACDGDVMGVDPVRLMAA
jgi:hypothetical protein